MNDYMKTHYIHNAEAKLKSALEDLKRAGCPKSADKVRSAIKSVGGAYRNAQNQEARRMIGVFAATATMTKLPADLSRDRLALKETP